MGNVVEAPGDAVHGLLHLVTREQFNRLREMEDGYSPVEVAVEAYDGRCVFQSRLGSYLRSFLFLSLSLIMDVRFATGC
jgi:hypothetical protein